MANIASKKQNPKEEEKCLMSDAEDRQRFTGGREDGELAFEPNALEVSHFCRSTRTMLAKESIILLRCHCNCLESSFYPHLLGGHCEYFSPESHELIP
eukprot:scaffold2121_cov81-Cylindrotheca_fusiformis.AAC.2